jgi:hypothetical protein
VTTSTGRSWNETADGSERALSSSRLWLSTSRLLMLTSSAYLRRLVTRVGSVPADRAGDKVQGRFRSPGGQALKMLSQVCLALRVQVHRPRPKVGYELVSNLALAAPPQASLARQGRPCGRQLAAHAAVPRPTRLADAKGTGDAARQ